MAQTDQTVTPDLLKSITEIARKLRRAQLDLVKHEQKVAELKGEIQRYEEKELLGLMEEAGMETFTLKGGFMVEVKSETYANISKERAPKAFAWLREHKFGGLIKGKVATSFGKGQDKQVKALVAAAKKLGFLLDVKEEVHPQTLRAWAREQLEQGAKVDETLFGIHVVHKAVLNEGKKVSK